MTNYKRKGEGKGVNKSFGDSNTPNNRSYLGFKNRVMSWDSQGNVSASNIRRGNANITMNQDMDDYSSRGRKKINWKMKNPMLPAAEAKKEVVIKDYLAGWRLNRDTTSWGSQESYNRNFKPYTQSEMGYNKQL